MKNIRFDAYYYKDEPSDPKLIVSLDWFSYEDWWHQRYLIDRPRYDEEKMEKLRIENLNRHRWFKIKINFFYYLISIEFRREKIGNVMRGRVMQDEPRPLRKRKELK
jgi:hypothetical protein